MTAFARQKLAAAALAVGLTSAALASTPAHAAGLPFIQLNGVSYYFDPANVSAGATAFDFTNDPAHKYLRIPSAISHDNRTYKVRAIGPSAFKDAPLVGAVLPDSLRTIGNEAFQDTDDLGQNDVVFGNGLTSIGQNAFFRSDLHRVVLPASLTYLGSGAFASNINLQRVTFKGAKPDPFGGYAFLNDDIYGNADIYYYSDFDSTQVANGFPLGPWQADNETHLITYMYPALTVTAPAKVKDNAKFTVKVKVRAGTRRVNTGKVAIRFRGDTKRVKARDGSAQVKFTTPNVTQAKKYPVSVTYGKNGYLLDRSKTRKVKVVE